MTGTGVRGPTVLPADGATDFAEAVRLSRAAMDWETSAYPQYRDITRIYYEPSKWAAFHDALPARFSAPGRGCFLARDASGRTVGMCMYSVDGGRVELHRLFVDPPGRGHGLGRALVDRCLQAGRAHGARRAILTTARFLTHAVALYEALGFRPCEAYQAMPDGLGAVVLFMERPLDPVDPG